MRTTSDAMAQASSCGQAPGRWSRCFPFGRHYHSSLEGDCFCGLAQFSRERRNPNCQKGRLYKLGVLSRTPIDKYPRFINSGALVEFPQATGWL